MYLWFLKYIYEKDWYINKGKILHCFASQRLNTSVLFLSFYFLRIIYLAIVLLFHRRLNLQLIQNMENYLNMIFEYFLKYIGQHTRISIAWSFFNYIRFSGLKLRTTVWCVWNKNCFPAFAFSLTAISLFCYLPF